MQTVPLRPFPPGEYELEVTVRDRLTRAVGEERPWHSRSRLG